MKRQFLMEYLDVNWRKNLDFMGLGSSFILLWRVFSPLEVWHTHPPRCDKPIKEWHNIKSARKLEWNCRADLKVYNKQLALLVAQIQESFFLKFKSCKLFSEKLLKKKRESSSLCTYEGGPYAWVGPLATSNRQPSWRRTTKPIADGELQKSIRKEKKERCFLLLLLQLRSGSSNSTKLLLLKTIKAYVLKYNLPNNTTCPLKMSHPTFIPFLNFTMVCYTFKVCHTCKGMSNL